MVNAAQRAKRHHPSLRCAPGDYIRAVPTPQHDAATLDRVRERLRSDGVEYCMATYADGHGIAKCKTVPLDHFHAMMHGSELFTGAALDMLGQSPADDELAVWPDPASVAAERRVRARQPLPARRALFDVPANRPDPPG